MSHSNSDTLLFLPSGDNWKWLSLVPTLGKPLKLFLLTNGFSRSRSLWKLDVDSFPSLRSTKLGSMKFLSAKARSLNSPSEKFRSLNGTSRMPNPPILGVPMLNLLRNSSSRRLNALLSNLVGPLFSLWTNYTLIKRLKKQFFKVTTDDSRRHFQSGRGWLVLVMLMQGQMKGESRGS